MMPSGAPVAVVVVTHNSAADLAPCLESVCADGAARVVVVDNASSDDSVQIARRLGVEVVEDRENRGYGTAANLGVEHTSEPYVLILNPDTLLRAGTLGSLVARFETDTRIGAVGPRLLDPDGSIQQSARRFPSIGTAALHGFLGLFWASNPATRRYTMADWDHASPREVDWVSGAAVAVRRDVWDKVGGFDPGYWMYVEDVDLCWRVRDTGKTVWYEPAGVVVHAIGTSSGSEPLRLLWAHHRSMLRFERVRRGGRRGPTWPVVVAGVGVRFLLTVVKQTWAGRKRVRR